MHRDTPRRDTRWRSALICKGFPAPQRQAASGGLVWGAFKRAEFPGKVDGRLFFGFCQWWTCVPSSATQGLLSGPIYAGVPCSPGTIQHRSLVTSSTPCGTLMQSLREGTGRLPLSLWCPGWQKALEARESDGAPCLPPPGHAWVGPGIRVMPVRPQACAGDGKTFYTRPLAEGGAESLKMWASDRETEDGSERRPRGGTTSASVLSALHVELCSDKCPQRIPSDPWGFGPAQRGGQRA